MNLTQKILLNHMTKKSLERNDLLEIRMDQTLTQDATGTLVYMQLEAMGIDQVKTEVSVSYVDHNTLQSGFMNADDHAYLQTVASKHGVYFSKPGNGICHQVHLERFAKPGCTLIGSDSHTPTSSALGCLAFGAGGLDVAKAMAGMPYTLKMPKIMQVHLIGRLKHGVSSKDIILYLLRKLSVKGGVGKVLEYTGEGVSSLSIYQRATITNMGAELGATTSIFPSDEQTKEFLKRQGRIQDYIELKADDDATYDETIVIDLNQLEPLVACPHSPDNVETATNLKNVKVDQVAIGSCTNSGFEDLMKVADILKGRHIADDVSLVISCGSRQVMMKLMQVGALSVFLEAGARILECTCGPCIGMGQSPKTNGVSLRTFNRNFHGRSGTLNAEVYLASPEVAAYSALTGYISDPRTVEYKDHFEEPIWINDSMIIKPSKMPNSVKVIRGPNIKPLPINPCLCGKISKKVVIKVEDNITTDHIAPAGSEVLPYRSNIEKLSTFVFRNNKEHFDRVCKENQGGIIVAGDNYGQGSSREHAALAPMYLGIKAVLAKSFARIHVANLINFGIVPFTFVEESEYDQIDEMDVLTFDSKDIENKDFIMIYNETKNRHIECRVEIMKDQRKIVMAGGALNYIRNQRYESDFI